MSLGYYKKISKILPGDLICDFNPRSRNGSPVLIISVLNENDLMQEVIASFLILGDDYLYTGISDKEKYWLLSRVEKNL